MEVGRRLGVVVIVAVILLFCGVAEADVAVKIQSNTIGKNSVTDEAGNSCYLECVGDCFDDNCSMTPWDCLSCLGCCYSKCKDDIKITSGNGEDVVKSHVAGEVPRSLLLHSHVADEQEQGSMDGCNMD